VSTYRVIWRFEIEAESAVAAAEQALEVQRHPKSASSLFEVTELSSEDGQADHSGPRITVDLLEVT